MMFWIHLGLLAIVVLGFTAIVVGALNRLHGWPLPCPVLHRTRQLHDILIVLFPFVLLWFVGLSGPRLLRGGSLHDTAPGWLVLFAICAAAAVMLMLSALWRKLRPVPAAQLSNHSTVIDVAAKLGRKPVGPGPYATLARFPGNQIFQLEIVEKELRLPRLPAAWDGLSILHLSDWHFIGTVDRAYFEFAVDRAAELRCDLAVFTGDLLDEQRYLEWIPGTLGRLQAPLGCYSILGNHDWYIDAAAIRAKLAQHGWQDVAGKVLQRPHRGSMLALGGSEIPWMGRHPDWQGVPAEAFRLLLSHTPDNLPWAREQGVDLMLSGHNHGGQVQLPVIGPVYSPSKYGCRYAGGLFWEPPTLLYVNRGLAGRHPLRLRCLPEITKLVLRAP